MKVTLEVYLENGKLQLFKKLSSQLDLEAKIEVLKKDYPALYIEYCKYFGLKTEIDDYIAECL